MRGYVYFQGEGGFPAQFLSDAHTLGLHISDTKRENETLYGWCPIREYKALRKPAKKACLRLRILRKSGLYFCLFPYRKRIGIPVGLVLGVLLLFSLSSRIWVVQVEKENTDLKDSVILSAAKDAGIFAGCDIQNIDMEALRLQMLSQLPDAVYVSVNPSGSVARVVVKGKEKQPSIQDFHQNFSNLVASMDGKILKTEVYSGQTMVKAGEGVTKGQLLVSGATFSDRGNTYLRRSAGKVMAETFHTLSAMVPFKETRFLPQGDVILRPFFRFLRWDIPLFDNSPLTGQFAVDAYYRLPRTKTVTLPIGWIDQRWQPLVPTEISFTAEQALFEADSRLAQQKQNLTVQGVKILEQTDKKVESAADGVTVTVTLRCEQDIAKEVPLTILDTPARN